MGYSIFVTNHYTFSGDLRVYGVVAESIGGIIKGEEALFLLHSQGTISSIIPCGNRIIHDIHLK